MLFSLGFHHFFRISIMKKNLIPALLFLALLVGCKGKEAGNSTTDSTSATAPGPRVDNNGTLMIMPPQTAKSPIQVGTQVGMMPDNVSFSGTFWGPNMQTVTITMPGIGNPPPFTGSNGTKWGPVTFLAPPNPPQGNFITVATSVIPPGYTIVNNSPLISPNLTGQLTSTYNDGPLGDSSQITVQDQGPPPPPPAAKK